MRGSYRTMLRWSVGAAALIGALLVTGFSQTESLAFVQATTADYEIVTPDCWEPDLVNTSGQTLTFRVQSVLGDGQTSEVHTTGPIPPGGKMHLHLFSDAWLNNTLPLIIARSEQHGCEMVVQTAPS